MKYTFETKKDAQWARMQCGRWVEAEHDIDISIERLRKVVYGLEEAAEQAKESTEYDRIVSSIEGLKQSHTELMAIRKELWEKSLELERSAIAFERSIEDGEDGKVLGDSGSIQESRTEDNDD